jgi:uncharacterized membrane-anchored protein
MQYWGNLAQTSSGDPDEDELTNIQEYSGGTNPTISDKKDTYAWTTYGIMAVLGGIIAAVLVFALAPVPPKYKAFVAITIALVGLVIAHLINIGGIVI